MKQLIHIHGGEAFDTYEEYLAYLELEDVDDPRKPKPSKWRDRYEEFLGEEWQTIKPNMPSGRNAKYNEWKLWFGKYFPYLEKEVVLVGHSLGAIFLAKYLSENIFPGQILSLHLIAGPFGWTGGFSLSEFPGKVAEQCDSIYLYHSHDDELVPFEDVKKFKEVLPNAELVTFENRGHFLQEEFPELIANIQEE